MLAINVFPLIVSVPVFVAKSLTEVDALTVIVYAPGGVEAEVLMVNVEVLVFWAEVNATQFGVEGGQLVENENVAPDGKPVTLRAASNAPPLPPPLPLFTVIKKVALPAVPYVSVPV
jgi:hypothetical protein